jgi:hypothetical protein
MRVGLKILLIGSGPEPVNKYQKKPVVVEAMQYHYPAPRELLEWMGDAAGAEHHNSPIDAPLSSSLDIYRLIDGIDRPARVVACDGDWIIKGGDGLFDRVSPEVFNAFYEEVN